MAKPKVGDTRGWNKKTGTGYKWNGKKWVQYRGGKPLGPFKGHGGITGNVDVVGGITNRIKTAPKRWKKRFDAINKKSAEAKKRREKEGVGEFKDPKEKEKLAAKNEAVTNPKPKTETKSKTKDKLTVDKEKAAWLKKTRNSPAAQSGAFSDDERWALQKRHRAWKAARKKKKN